MDFPPPIAGGGMDLSPPSFQRGGGGIPPPAFGGLGGEFGVSPPDFLGGEFGVSPPAKRGEKILAYFTSSPPFFDPFPPRHGGGIGHFRVPPPSSAKIPPSWRRGGTKSQTLSPPVFRDHGGGIFCPPPVFREAGGGLQKTVPPRMRGGGDTIYGLTAPY